MKAVFTLLLFVQLCVLSAQDFLTHTPEPSVTSLSQARCIEGEGDYLHVVYTEGEPWSKKVMYVRGFSGGSFWENPVEISSGIPGTDPSVAVRDGVVHVVFADEYGSSVYYVKSTDEGTTWNTAQPLVTIFENVSNPSLAVAEGKVHVAWQQLHQSEYEIHYIRSDNNGDEWNNPVQLTFNGANAVKPGVEAYESYVHILFADYTGVNYIRSDDAGETWPSQGQNLGNVYVSNHSITVFENIVMVCWADSISGAGELIARRSTDHGATWEDSFTPIPPFSRPFSPHIDAGEKIIFLVWNEMLGNNWAIISSFSIDQGLSWSPPEFKFPFSGFSIRPFVKVLDKTGHIICTDKTENEEIVYEGQDVEIPFQSINTLVWGHNIGGLKDSGGYDVANDDEGNVYITGNFSATVDFDPGAGTLTRTAIKESDIFVAKYDSTGQVIWVVTAGGQTWDQARALALDATGNIYVVGEFHQTVDFNPGPGVFNLEAAGFQDAFIWKLGPDGSFIWAKKFSGSISDIPFFIVINSAGTMMIGGVFGESTDFDPSDNTQIHTVHGRWDAFVTFLNLDGEYLSSHTYGGAELDFVYMASVDQDDAFVVTGTFNDSIDIDPGPAVQYLTSKGSNDVFIIKYNPDGSLQWGHAIGKVGYDNGQSIVTDNSNNILVVGDNQNGNFDLDPGPGVAPINTSGAFLVKLAPDGSYLWGKGFSGSIEGSAELRVDSLQNIYLMCNSEGLSVNPASPNTWLHSRGQTDSYIIKLTPGGDFIWANQFKGDAYSYGYGLSLYKNDIYTIGHFGDNLDFDPSLEVLLEETQDPQTSNIYLLKIRQCPAKYDTLYISACDQYISPDDGTVWNTTGTYHRQLISYEGCDSLVTVHLTILPQSALQVDVEACNTFTAPDGNPTITISGTIEEIYTNVGGCDSTVIYNVTIHHDQTASYSQHACNSYTTPDGLYTWTSSGVYQYILPALNGCDSLITADITITTLDLTVLETPTSLLANQPGATYQWMDCNSDNAIAGATSQEFYPTVNGNYAVIIASNDCIDTSACILFSTVSTDENLFERSVHIYPNPAKDYLHIDMNGTYPVVHVEIEDMYGRQVYRQLFYTGDDPVVNTSLPDGVYVVHVRAGDEHGVFKIVFGD